MSGTTTHRISVNVPFSKVRMWAIGAPSKINIDTSGHHYLARDVPEVVASLKRVLVGDAVITVY
jgi:hypothetical protein